MTWQPIETAPILEDVLICQAGRASSRLTAYKGDGSAKHPAVWISLHSREPLSEFDDPTHWMPLPAPPAE